MTTDLDSLLLSEAKMADVLGIGRKSLTDLRLAGKIEPAQAKPIRYAAGPTIRSELQRLRDAASARVSEVVSDDSSKLDPVREGSLLKRAQRQLIEAKLNQMQGDLVDRETMQAAINVVCSTARTRILSMPAALSSRLHGLTRSDQVAITEACHQILQDLADDSARIPDLLKKRVLQDTESLIDAAAKDNRK